MNALRGIVEVARFILSCERAGWARLPDYVAHRRGALFNAGFDKTYGAEWICVVSCAGAKDVSPEWQACGAERSLQIARADASARSRREAAQRAEWREGA